VGRRARIAALCAGKKFRFFCCIRADTAKRKSGLQTPAPPGAAKAVAGANQSVGGSSPSAGSNATVTIANAETTTVTIDSTVTTVTASVRES